MMAKTKVLKALLTCNFIPWLLNSFDLISYGLKLEKKYTPRLFCLEEMDEVGGAWRLFYWENGLAGRIGYELGFEKKNVSF